MDFFRDFTMRWWEFGLLKVSVMALGIILGSYWAAFFRRKGFMLLLWLVFILPSIYLLYVTFQQAK